jgi:predicted NAD-dependent protein-ADP-ribosyltransferase YbiA (DUF1768 family)
MKAILKDDTLVLVPDDEEEELVLAIWKEERAGHVLLISENRGEGITLKDLGPKADACNEPINVTSRHPDDTIKLIGNFADTPFELDGRRYASVESFWQSLKFEDAKERRRIAEIKGPAARSQGDEQGYGATITYEGLVIVVGTRDHWELMRRANEAKFAQNFDARAALLATGNRPLTHIVRRDSRSIPGVVMASIWMGIRKKLAGEKGRRPAPWSLAKSLPATEGQSLQRFSFR